MRVLVKKMSMKQNPDFKGITIGNRRIKISQFADDTTLFLRGPQDLPAAEKSLAKWCRATGMRENKKKREGLAMGIYRKRKKLPKGVAWVKEGESAKILGVPIGNIWGRIRPRRARRSPLYVTSPPSFEGGRQGLSDRP